MALYIDTEEVAAIANDLLLFSDQLEAEFNNLFKRFSGIPDVTREWIGRAANYYFGKIADDKDYYLRFVDELRAIANNLMMTASRAQDCVKRNISLEQ